MHAAVLGAAVAILGVNVGWERLPDGGVEYVIQFNADDLERFRVERVFESDIPSRVKDIRRYRIELGSLPLRQDELPKDEPAPRGPASPSDAARRGSQRSAWVRPPQSGAPAVPDYLLRPEDKKASKAKGGTAAPGSGAESKPGQRGEAQVQADKATPWVPLTAVMVALFGSLGGNLYLGWMMWETRRRYRGVLRRQRKTRETATDQGSRDNDQGSRFKGQ